MAQEITPGDDARGHRFCLVASRFNERYVERMVSAALDVLRGRGAGEDDLTIVWVPGSFELPLTCRWAAASGRYDAVLAFGAVVQGETDHYRIVADVSARGLLQAMMDTDVPVLNGVLAVRDAEQASAGTGGALGNRGAEVALAAVQMGRLRREMRPR
ncbi:MAG: 6,7-dimethyl-8-ribityllumazine synthase [Candidatus Eisenbacteria bacterium]|uniref:6,7-dimethyl-8-ribityllumazine synthase n=1 Tax=Eiseniibacteriota bacterium TaxID=2212470 RepID=A0A538U1E7_UNCEI|nr:MAG: 6,7-dimethyl-8-ribityllumazine synthase [Candidatus Eisenbacteria bacterium]